MVLEAQVAPRGLPSRVVVPAASIYIYSCPREIRQMLGIHVAPLLLRVLFELRGRLLCTCLSPASFTGPLLSDLRPEPFDFFSSRLVSRVYLLNFHAIFAATIFLSYVLITLGHAQNLHFKIENRAQYLRHIRRHLFSSTRSAPLSSNAAQQTVVRAKVQQKGPSFVKRRSKQTIPQEE